MTDIWVDVYPAERTGYYATLIGDAAHGGAYGVASLYRLTPGWARRAGERQIRVIKKRKAREEKSFAARLAKARVQNDKANRQWKEAAK